MGSFDPMIGPLSYTIGEQCRWINWCVC